MMNIFAGDFITCTCTINLLVELKMNRTIVHHFPGNTISIPPLQKIGIIPFEIIKFSHD